MKKINGILTPQNFDDAFGSWILHSAAVMCGLCLRGKERNGEVSKQATEDSYYIPREEWKNYTPTALKGLWKVKRWYAYKTHIRKVHKGNWDLRQGFGSPDYA
tara:strand:- start:127 stop:435 length:309 start_codon:yes stop_codon:yes gene_type:complete